MMEKTQEIVNEALVIVSSIVKNINNLVGAAGARKLKEQLNFYMVGVRGLEQFSFEEFLNTDKCLEKGKELDLTEEDALQIFSTFVARLYSNILEIYGNDLGRTIRELALKETSAAIGEPKHFDIDSKPLQIKEEIDHNKLSSGVDFFDKLIGGGFPISNQNLLYGPTSEEMYLFGFSFIKKGLLLGDSCIIVCSTISPAEVIRQLESIGIDCDKYGKDQLLFIIDAYSWKAPDVPPLEKSYCVKVEKVLLSISVRGIQFVLSKIPPEARIRAFVNLASSILTYNELGGALEFYEVLCARLRGKNVTAIHTLNKGVHDEKTVATWHTLFDGVIEIDIHKIEKNGKTEITRRIGVLNMSGTTYSDKYVEFAKTERGLKEVKK